MSPWTALRTPGKRVLVAARLSRINAEGGRDRIERDDEAAQDWAERQGLTIVAVSKDEGISGGVSPFKRPKLGPWLKEPALVASYDVIVASSIDRLARNYAELIRLKDWAVKAGKQLRIISPALHWPVADDDLTGKLIWHILGEFAEYELTTIKGRYATQRADLIARNALVGKQCWGFEVYGERGSKSLRPAIDTLPYLLGLVERARQGETLLSICRWLDSEGIAPRQTERGKSSAGWSPTSLRQVLRNPALKGRRYDANGRKTLEHEGIMSATDWQSLQSKLDARGNKRNPTGREKAFLTGSILCDLCGGPMYRNSSVTTRKDGTKNLCEYYRCKGTDQEPSKCSNLIPVERAERFVNGLFSTEPVDFGDEGETEGHFSGVELFETVVIPGSDHLEDVADIETDLRTLDYDAPDFAERQQALLRQRAELKARPAEAPQVVRQATGRTIGEVWPGLSSAAKIAFLKAADINVRIRPVKAEERSALVRPAGKVEASFLSRTHAGWLLGDPETITGTLEELESV